MSCRSYGEVYSAIDKKTEEVVAIKVIPGRFPNCLSKAVASSQRLILRACMTTVEAEIDEVMKEINILKKCNSPYVVRYMGNYLKDGDLWVSVFLCEPTK